MISKVMAATLAVAVSGLGVLAVTPTPAKAQSDVEAEIIGFHQLCDKGDRRACVRFGILIGENKQRHADWRRAHADWWWWEKGWAWLFRRPGDEPGLHPPRMSYPWRAQVADCLSTSNGIIFQRDELFYCARDMRFRTVSTQKDQGIFRPLLASRRLDDSVMGPIPDRGRSGRLGRL
jgi:hypothetical protein